MVLMRKRNEERFVKCLRSSRIPGITRYLTECSGKVYSNSSAVKCIPQRKGIWTHPEFKTCLKPIVMSTMNKLGPKGENNVRAGYKATRECAHRRCSPTQKNINMTDKFINGKTTFKQFMNQWLDMKINARFIKYSKCVMQTCTPKRIK